MQLNLHLRPLIDLDGPALAGLSFSASDHGGIAYAANYRVDAVLGARALYGEMDGVAAFTPGSARMVGVGITRYGTCTYQDELLPFALIGNLVAHLDFHRHGLVDALVEWQVNHARARLGAQSVLLAAYQRRNQTFDRAFGRWLKDRTGPLEVHMLPALSEPPASEMENGKAILVGPLGENEDEAFAEHLNAFYAGHNFHQPASAQVLAGLTRQTLFDSPFRHAYAAVDRRGNLLAGLLVSEEYRIRELEVRALPAGLKVLNWLAHRIPDDGLVREVRLDHLWFRPGGIRAVQHLVDTVRWIWSNRATIFSAQIDPRGPLKALFPHRPWSVMTRAMLASAGPRPVDPNRLVRPML